MKQQIQILTEYQKKNMECLKYSEKIIEIAEAKE